MAIIKWILAAAVLVALIGGASVLYNNLSEGRTDNVQIFDETETSAESESTPAQTAASSEEISETTAETTAKTEPQKVEQVENKMDPTNDFSFTDINGKTVMLSDFIGKPIVLNFWATWCIYCKLEMPAFDEIYKQYGEEVNFVMMNVTSGSETVDVAKKFIENAGYSFPIYFDTQQAGAIKYNTAKGIPMTFFFDKTGVLKAWASGAIDAATLESALDRIR